MKAKFYAKNNNYLESKKLFETVLKAFPKNRSAQEELENLKLNKYNKSVQNNTAKEVDRLFNLFNQRKFSLLVNEAENLIKLYPNEIMIWNLLGASATNLGMFEKAIEAYKKCISIKPNFAEAHNNLGVVFKSLSKLDQAVESYNKAISINPSYVNAICNLGVVLHEQGNINKSIEMYKKAISINPNFSDAYNNLGIALKDKGNLEEAVNAYKTAILLNSNNDNAYNNMGNALKVIGNFEESIKAFDVAIYINPYNIDAYNNKGNALQDQQKLKEAVEVYNKAITIQPNYANTYNNLGVTLNALGNYKQAENLFNKTLLINPNHPDANYNLGITLDKQGKSYLALKEYKNALSINPFSAKIYNNIGAILLKQGKFKEALKTFKKSISLKSKFYEAYSNLGNTFKELGALDKAIISYKKSISINPDYADAYNNLGNALVEKGKVEEAQRSYKKAIKLKPNYAEAHQNLSYTLLNCGKLHEGLDEYEWRWKKPIFFSQKRNFSKPLWDGKQSLKDKKILLWSEQGIGDTIVWASRVPLIASKAKKCILECQEKLVPLLKSSFPNINVKPANTSNDSKRDDFDFHLPMGSIYKYFIKDILENTKVKPYLVPDTNRVKYWKKRLDSLGNGPYVGISWKSSNMSSGRIQNYSSILDWSRIITIPNVTFINLQNSNFEDDLDKFKSNFGVTVHNFDDLDHFNDLLDVASLSSALDMVVSNKTTIPLISAGVGTLTKLANWKESPWNNFLLNPPVETVDIFERSTWETWENVFNLIAEEIELYKKTYKNCNKRRSLK